MEERLAIVLMGCLCYIGERVGCRLITLSDVFPQPVFHSRGGCGLVQKVLSGDTSLKLFRAWRVLVLPLPLVLGACC